MVTGKPLYNVGCFLAVNAEGNELGALLMHGCIEGLWICGQSLGDSCV
ncbi:MAG: hypothetical protein ACP5NY_05415 [Thermocladium sp.]